MWNCLNIHYHEGGFTWELGGGWACRCQFHRAAGRVGGIQLSLGYSRLCTSYPLSLYQLPTNLTLCLESESSLALGFLLNKLGANILHCLSFKREIYSSQPLVCEHWENAQLSYKLCSVFVGYWSSSVLHAGSIDWVLLCAIDCPKCQGSHGE